MALRRLLLLYSRQLHHPIIIPTSKHISTPFKPPTTHHHHFHSTSLSLAQTTATPDTARALNIKKSPKKKADSKPKKSRKSPVQFQNSRFSKQRKGRVSGSCSCGGDDISFGTFGLRALEPGWLTARAIRAGRGAMARYARGGGKLWVRVIPDKSVTTRPAETRMGRGKGAVAFMVGCVKPGRIIYEMTGVTEKVAREAFLLAASKMPIRTNILVTTVARTSVAFGCFSGIAIVACKRNWFDPKEPLPTLLILFFSQILYSAFNLNAMFNFEPCN